MTELEDRLLKENAILKEENRFLQQKVHFLVRRIFGVKSEKIDPNQLQLGLGLNLPPAEPEATPSIMKDEAKPAKKSTRFITTKNRHQPQKLVGAGPDVYPWTVERVGGALS